MENFRGWLDRSRRLLDTETLDLVQLHCPPSAVIDDDATWDSLDQLVSEGVIAAYGASVETMDQALSALRRPNLTNLQIIFNPFRLKPLDEVLCPSRPRRTSRSSHAFRWPAACCRASTRPTRPSPRTTIAATTATARPSTRARLLGCAVRRGCRRGRRAQGIAARGRDPAGGDARVDRVAPRRHGGHPGGAFGAAGGLQRGRGRPARRWFRPRGFDALVRDVYDRRLRAEIHPQW